MSGKKKQNTCTAVSDGDGRLLRRGAFWPDRMHDTTALRTESTQDLLQRHPGSRAKSMRATKAGPEQCVNQSKVRA